VYIHLNSNEFKT